MKILFLDFAVGGPHFVLTSSFFHLGNVNADTVSSEHDSPHFQAYLRPLKPLYIRIRTR